MSRSKQVVIAIGSNINPELNVEKAKEKIDEICTILKESQFIYTKPLLYVDQADFLNGAILIKTCFDLETLKKKLKDIELTLGRKRSKNKNGPRSIDLDILIYDDIVTDKDVFERDFLREFISQLLPDFRILSTF